MRYLYAYICLSLLLLSSVTFANKEAACSDRIPNSPNFIISGGMLRQTIRCLEDLIEARHASTIAAIQAQAQAVIAAKTDEPKKDASQKDASETDTTQKNEESI